jgi:pyruvate/2-oxoacid:ferredoxin oxidoreductase beta subunit
VTKGSRHKGYALIDILQPCVSFNQVNTYQCYKDRVYKLGEDYNPKNTMADIEKAIIEKLVHEEEKHAEVLGNIIQMLNPVNEWVESAEFNHNKPY